jgi:hypothetical protein
MTDQNASNADEVPSGKRGPTFLTKLTKERAKGVPPQTVTFNEAGQITGPPRFQTYLGCQARTHIPITIEDWGKVDKKVKEDIWEEANVSEFLVLI